MKTLIYVAMAAIGILAGIVIVAINPVKQLGVTRNAQRQADVTTILKAVYQYTIDNSGPPASITLVPTEICATGGVCTSLIDLSVLTTAEKYLTSIPLEPQKTNPNGAGYKISKDANGRFTVRRNIVGHYG